ncbi:hypothetical protein RRG08_030833 [Elysia crispata]|uniref:Uncharacterized protein n=1 Tax=Elysia crispata TaxID=231223 RepID=A0AAE1DWY1_9GAST|nr:hypothetical protein RRG08_030833 [Elysia crispata]
MCLKGNGFLHRISPPAYWLEDKNLSRETTSRASSWLSSFTDIVCVSDQLYPGRRKSYRNKELISVKQNIVRTVNNMKCIRRPVQGVHKELEPASTRATSSSRLRAQLFSISARP